MQLHPSPSCPPHHYLPGADPQTQLHTQPWNGVLPTDAKSGAAAQPHVTAMGTSIAFCGGKKGTPKEANGRGGSRKDWHSVQWENSEHGRWNAWRFVDTFLGILKLGLLT